MEINHFDYLRSAKLIAEKLIFIFQRILVISKIACINHCIRDGLIYSKSQCVFSEAHTQHKTIKTKFSLKW